MICGALPMLLAGYQKGQGGKMDGFLFFRYSIFLSGDTCSSLSSSESVRYLLWMKSTSIQLHILLFQRKESQVLMFYWNIFKGEQPPLLWWCWKWAAAFSAKSNLLARLMPHSSAGFPRRWPGADAVKLDTMKGKNLDFGPKLLQMFHPTLVPSKTGTFLEAASNMCFERFL